MSEKRSKSLWQVWPEPGHGNFRFYSLYSRPCTLETFTPTDSAANSLLNLFASQSHFYKWFIFLISSQPGCFFTSVMQISNYKSTP